MTAKDEIERTIRFYKITLEKEEEVINPSTVLNYISSLGYPDRYRELKDGRSWSMEFYGNIGGNETRIILGTKRVAGLPQVEENGLRSPLPLRRNQGLFEPTHFSLFSGNVLGMEYNQYGPKTGALEDYIKRKAERFVDDIKILPIPREDLMNTLRKIGEVKVMDFGALSDRSEHLRKLDETLAASFNEMKNWSDIGPIGLFLKPNSSKDQGTFRSIIKNAGKHREDKELWDSVLRFKVRARDETSEKIELFDLLENLVKSNKDIKKENGSRSVDSESMFSSIREAYLENIDDIRRYVS